jgi:hypothetical protein
MVLCLAACDQPRDDTAHADVAAEPWEVDASPFLDVVATPVGIAPSFSFAASATLLPGGELVIANPYDATILFFDTSGRLVRTLGHRGDGPGEFDAPASVMQCGRDSVFVWDYMHSRISVVDPAGRIAREYDEAPNAADLTCTRSGVVAGFLGPRVSRPPNREGELLRAPLWVSDTHPTEKRQIGDLPYAENRPMGRRTRIAVTDDYLYVGASDSSKIYVYDLGGKRLRTIDVGVPPRHPTQHQYERAIDALVQPMSDASMRERSRRDLLKIPSPEWLPAYSGLFADPKGLLWVLTSVPGDSDTQLRAVSASGSVLGKVRVGRELRVFEVGINYVLGSYPDENGRTHVVAYRYHRPAGVVRR